MSLGKHRAQRFVVTIYVDPDDYPHGPHRHDVQTAICHAIGNGNIPSDGVTVEQLSHYLERRLA